MRKDPRRRPRRTLHLDLLAVLRARGRHVSRRARAARVHAGLVDGRYIVVQNDGARVATREVERAGVETVEVVFLTAGRK